ncbi:hypothetical protein [Niabella sp.]|uniref:hypothetical protein n=1 Tax=Niabella sp. TaxID=1962976 RepID=UPI00260AB4B2|nr:hypothetical protein [Niabella sp.]
MEPTIENADALKSRIGNVGFGNRFDKEIDEALAAGSAEIRPFTSEVIENRRMDFEPEIKIKDNKGYYNGFKATFYNEDGTTVTQWFKAADRVTINEAYILMVDQQHPRAVHKTYYNEAGEKYGQWVQLDFSQRTESGNYLTKRYGDFDQVAKLNDYAFVELASEKQKITAAAHLADGREIALTPVNQEKYSQIFVRANPERGTFTFTDVEGKLLYHDQFRTPEALERILQDKNTRQASVSFVRNQGNGVIPGKNSVEQDKSETQKKNSVPESETLKPNKTPRVVQDGGQQRGKSI